jgi:DNA-directed RNA polymerase specialized sigma24 family protein
MIPKQQSQDQKIQSLKNAFSQDVATLLHPDNEAGTRLLNVLQRLAKQLNIRNFDVREVLSEATMRGLDSIDRKGEPIASAFAWLRSIGTRVIKDQVKAEIKTRRLIEKHSNHSETADSWIKLVFEEEGKAASMAGLLLSTEDQEILRLRFVEEMCYGEIQAYYFEKVGIFVAAPTLRKRESRAVDRLKAKFAEIYKQ